MLYFIHKFMFNNATVGGKKVLTDKIVRFSFESEEAKKKIVEKTLNYIQSTTQLQFV